ncbi:hypothetical protein GIB67_037023 [Kingdonia uniflora]|uniref:Serine-threonine/tyrosine-protein kinase catalytic domain-containing protein n=1 Tax=Kingdonia uniflora TaxID=39325 RepID=A0A7J7LHJ4_9MAGN|nr:hypothetical protein GIB67_037023 [Kingdonia uniflora]
MGRLKAKRCGRIFRAKAKPTQAVFNVVTYEIGILELNSSATKEVKEQFMAEVRTIGRTYHKNLVRLYGFCFDANLKAKYH